jgi:ornithine carbamoyltransferase
VHNVLTDFLSVCDASKDEILAIFRRAARMKAKPARYALALRGKTLAMIFEKPSLRTRVSFDVGMQQLGGFTLTLLPQEIQIGKRESLHDVARTLERMVQAIMIRTFAHEYVVELARHASVPVINGLSDYEHPCQALADYFTILEVKGKLEGLRLCYVGDGNNVAHSLLGAGARLGVNVMIACPEGHEPHPSMVQQARDDAGQSGARITITHDPAEGVEGADVVYTDVWTSMGREAEAEMRQRVFRPFQVNMELMAKAHPDAIFLHCLPARRGEEVTDEVIDAPCSRVFQQAENRLHVQKALLYELMSDEVSRVEKRRHRGRRKLAHSRR